MNDQQTEKLRLLSLITLSSSPKTLTYTTLLSDLSLPTTQALEALAIKAIYLGLLSAKLDPLAQHIAVFSVAPLRDVPLSQIPVLIQTLEEWDGRCGDVLKEIDAQIAQVKADARARRKREKRAEELFEKEMEKALSEFVEKVGGGGGDEMDVDVAVGGAGGVRLGRSGPKEAQSGGRKVKASASGYGRKLGGS